MSSIVSQGKALGTFMYLFTGGEPLVRKKDIIRLCEEHSDCVFSAFTNGSLIDDAFAEDMLRVKNFVPAISIEGFEEATDSRRGKGTYQETIRAMNILREHKLPFGISCCYTSANADVIGSEEFFDAMIDMGALFAWIFTYMPVGKKAVPELMVTAEQREFMYHQVREFRKTKPLFTVDFWNDGEFVGGCIAGGRSYCHINANGDIEPCAFIHYSDSNIREKTLLEAYQSPLFMGYRHNQPFNGNMLRPCPVLDNPGRLTAIVEESGAVSTDYSDTESAKEYSDKCVEKAALWKPVSEKLWTGSGHEL
jgi:MoaA/NifB/PqqE/SkfB family radical SAM enzyme